MKRKGKIFALVVSAVAAVAACGALTACGKLQADGPVYEYKMAPTDKAPYEFTGNVTSTVVPDAEITIDGKFEEGFYEGRKLSLIHI